MFHRYFAFLWFALWPFCAGAQTLTVADSVQSYATLTNTTVTMTGKSELHVTGTSNPITGSTIHLNSKDSWLWLDNIRPNTADDYLGQIKVNGVTAVHGTNVRVVQYGMGTVITPFTSGEQPLETFTGPKFTGDSKRYSLYTYYDTPGELGTMSVNISSFKLKRGYMATFGTEADGTGISKVYIAQDQDVTVGAMPGSLENAIRFVRVFPWRWVSKKGSCDVAADKLNAAWFYNWNNDQNSTLNWEYVPIKQQRWWPAYPTDKTSVTHLSGYNEPDNPVEDSYTSLSNGSRDAAIAAWPELLATGLRVGSPACTDGGRWWLYEFMDKAAAANLRVDYVTIHFYSCGYTASTLYNWLKEIHDRTGKPLWVTEFNNGANWTGCGDPSYTGNASVINSFIDMMDNTPWIERYAVYSNVESVRNMVYSDGSLTPAGAVYRDQISPIGYLQEEYPMAVKRGVVQLPLDGNTRDTSGYENGGVCYGAPTYAAGQHGQALQFNGSGVHVKLPAAVANSSSFTFASWVYWEGGATNQRIFDFGNDTSQFFFLSPGVGGEMRLGLRNGSGTTGAIATTALPTGSWQHVAVTMQGTTAKIYLNGVQQVQGTLPDPALSGTMQNYLGKSQWAADPFFNGKLDDVTIADSAMTGAQIAALMANTLPTFAAHWKGDVDGSWSTTNNAGNTNWATSAAGTTDAGQSPAANTTVNFSTAVGNASATTLDSDFSIEGLTVASPSAVGIGGTHDLTIGAGGIDILGGAGATTINTSGRVQLGANQTWFNNSPNDLTVGGVVSGSGTLNVAGSGRIVLAGANDLTGEVVVYGGGSVSVASIGNALGTASAVRLGGGGSAGTLIYTGTGETTARILTFNGGLGTPGMVIDQSGSGLLKLTANTASNASVAKTLTLQGSNGGAGEISGIIANGGTTTSLTKAGTGTWTLSGANTYTGTTTLSEGTLAIGNNAAFGTGTVDLRGATLQSSDATTRTIGNAISFSADTAFNGTGNLRFTGAVNAGSLIKTFTVTNQTEFSGVISGTGARTKAGSGTLVMSGANSYTGTTTVSGGTLAVNGSLAAGSAVTVANGAVLTGTGTIKGATTFASGSRLGWSLTTNDTGAGKLSAGAVNVTGGAAANLVFNGTGSTVDFSDVFWTQSHTWPVLASSGMAGSFMIGSVGTDSAGHSITGYGNFHLQQNPAGVKLFYAPLGALPPPTPTGLSVIVSPGGVALAWNPSLEAAGYNVLRSTQSGGPYELIAAEVVGMNYSDRSVSNGTTYYYVVVAMSPNGESEPTPEIAATPHLPSSINKADNPASLISTDSWLGGIVPVASDIARWAGLAGANSVSLGSNASWNGIVMAATGGPVSIGAGNSLSIGAGGVDMSASTQNLTISSGLTLGAGNQTWNVAAGKTLEISGAFTRSTGSMLLVDKSANSGAVTTGTIVNSGSTGIVGPWAIVKSSGPASNNSAGGHTYATVNGGSIVPFSAATASGFNWTSTNGNSFNYDINATAGNIGVNRVANTIRYTGAAGTQNFGSNNTTAVTLNGLMNAGTGVLTLSQAGGSSFGQVAVGANNANELDLIAANAGLAIAIPVINTGSTAGSVAIAGANTVTLGGANTFTGGAYLNGGSLLVGNNSALGTGTFTLNGGTVATTGSALTRTLANPVLVNSSTSIRPAGTASIRFNGNITGTGSLDFAGILGSNEIRLAGDNSAFNGTMIITGNNVRLNTGAASGAGANWVVNSGLQLDGTAAATNTYHLGSLSGNGNINGHIINAAATSQILSVGALGSNTTFSGVIQNNSQNTAVTGSETGTNNIVSLTKVGPGALTLTGTSSYTGATTVNAGMLIVNGALTGGGALTVNAGGTLAGTGSNGGAVTVSSGGAISPGNGSGGGVLALSGALTLNGGSVLNASIGTASSRVALAGNLTTGGITTVNVRALTGFGSGNYSLITGAAGIDASNFVLGIVPGGYIYTLSSSSGTLSLKVDVPLTAPAALTATAGNPAIALSWAASPAATSYTVKRSTSSGAGYVTLASDITVPGYADTGLNVGMTYYYVVSAVNLTGESEDSNEASAKALSASEAWRQQEFGTTDNGGDAADGADPDKDGLNNLMEYALGSGPTTSNAGAVPHGEVMDGKLTITFTRNTIATDVVMNVWGIDDLVSGTWEEIARSAGGSAFTDDLNGISTGATISENGGGAIRSVHVGDVFPFADPAHPKRFLKLKVER